MSKKINTNYYGVPIYALNEIAKSMKGGKFVTVDEENRLVFHYTPMEGIWLANLINVSNNGKLVNVDKSEDGRYWSLPTKFIDTCNSIFCFDSPKTFFTEDADSYILCLFHNNVLDGTYGEEMKSNDKSVYWYEIKNKVITRYSMKRPCEAHSYESNKKDATIPYSAVLETWESDEDVLAFFRNYGWMMGDRNIVAYSLNHIKRICKNVQ